MSAQKSASNLTEGRVDLLDCLRAKNPHLKFCSVEDLKRLELGELVDGTNADGWIKHLETRVAMPESGTAYVPSVPDLEAEEEFDRLAQRLYGEMSLQFGYCIGFNQTLNALEWHKGSETIVAATDLVLLLDRWSRIGPGGFYSPDELRAVLLRRGMVVELYAGTLHFAPLHVHPSGFRAGIVLPRNTNLPLEHEVSRKEPFLWARNKWLVAHPDSPQAARGACVGIQGANIRFFGTN